MSFRRTIQLFCLAVFLLLMTAAVVGVLPSHPLDFFLRLDPSLAAASVIAGRYFSPGFVPAVVLILLCPFLGRFFCGYVCPLGTTLDGGDKILTVTYKHQQKSKKLRTVKYLLVVFMLASALFGVSLVFAASPLSLATRFYGLLIQPILAIATNETMSLIQPLLDEFDLNLLLMAQVDTPRFATQLFILSFFVLLFGLARFTPRFWCRYICPAGALLALASGKPLIRRSVSSECNDCGKCARSCPMGAIPEEDFAHTHHRECIVCLQCRNVCPERAVSFEMGGKKPEVGKTALSLSRRGFILSGLTGAGTAAVGITGLESLYGKPGEGQVAPHMLLRPPASLPETEFLSRCVRCGECMIACPTNTLQPIWLKSGFTGMFSPALTARRGFCNPECHLCSEVCPTEAIRSLPKSERTWAKTGTAAILRHKCLAWEQEKSCMVCDEVCPFDAVVFKKEPGIPVAVPVVVENKCAGCGYCEYHCPVQNQSAIVVTPMGEMRMAEGSYKRHGQALGLQISLAKKQKPDQAPPETEYDPDGTAPGFETDESTQPAPGFEADTSTGPAPGFETND
ncbi:MAG: 4Fe-4S binding protein [Proteobacteria bacterium]|nr:4Fe-4S binding protein [Pseudomonadota bacterium]